MKKYFILIILIFIIFIVDNCISKNDGVNTFEDKLSLCRLDKIEDIEFKNCLVEFLYYESNLDYENMYRYLSKNYLQERFPNINNANEYKERMIDRSEALESDYLLLLDNKKIDEHTYQVDLIFETNNEGNIQKMKTRYYFIYEDDMWKYNGLDIDYMDVIE